MPQDDDMLGALAKPLPDAHATELRPRNPNRRPLVIRKELFFRLQETQRMQKDFPDDPEFDLGYLGSAALSIVFALPNSDELILKQARIEYSKEVQSAETS